MSTELEYFYFILAVIYQIISHESVYKSKSFIFFLVSNAEQLATHRKKKKKNTVQQKTYGKPGPKFCLDNENKTKKKREKKIEEFFLARHWMKENIFQASRKAHVFPIFCIFLVKQCHAKHNTCTGIWVEGREEGCRAAAILWNSFFHCHGHRNYWFKYNKLVQACQTLQNEILFFFFLFFFFLIVLQASYMTHFYTYIKMNSDKFFFFLFFIWTLLFPSNCI